MSTTYKINGRDFEEFGVGVVEQKGLFEPLAIKELKTYSSPSQHGVMVDEMSARRYSERTITLAFHIFDLTGGSMELFSAFRNELLRVPARMCMIDNGVTRVWDVVWKSQSALTLNGRRGISFDTTLMEPAPVKRVYKVTGDTASFTTAHRDGLTQPKLTFSWGDGTFDEGREGTHEHTYHDGQTAHYVIVSGVVEDCEITTTANLEYSVLW